MDKPETKTFAEPKPLMKVDSIEQKSGEGQEVASSGANIGGHLGNNVSNKGNERISELLE